MGSSEGHPVLVHVDDLPLAVDDSHLARKGSERGPGQGARLRPATTLDDERRDEGRLNQQGREDRRGGARELGPRRRLAKKDLASGRNPRRRDSPPAKLPVVQHDTAERRRGVGHLSHRLPREDPKDHAAGLRPELRVVEHRPSEQSVSHHRGADADDGTARKRGHPFSGPRAK